MPKQKSKSKRTNKKDQPLTTITDCMICEEITFCTLSKTDLIGFLCQECLKSKK